MKNIPGGAACYGMLCGDAGKSPGLVSWGTVWARYYWRYGITGPVHIWTGICSLIKTVVRGIADNPLCGTDYIGL